VECLHVLIDIVLLTNLGPKLESQVVSSVLSGTLTCRDCGLLPLARLVLGMYSAAPLVEAVKAELPAFLGITALKEIVSLPLVLHVLVSGHRVRLLFVLSLLLY
jgi:hypothetical protein